MKRMIGFSLVELMIAVAIVGILAAVAYPSYTEFVRDGYRSKAQADLLALAAAMNSHQAVNYTFEGAGSSSDGNTGSPTIFSDHSPADSPAGDKKYDLTISDIRNNGREFSVRATPTAGTVMAGDGFLEVSSNTGVAWDADNSGGLSASEHCWQC